MTAEQQRIAARQQDLKQVLNNRIIVNLQ